MNSFIYCTFVLLFLCNSVFSKKDFVFTAVAPSTVNPSQNQFLVLLSVEEGISNNITVKFNVTINKLKDFVVKPLQQITLLPLERGVVEFNISKEFELLNNEYPKELEIHISANTGNETNQSKVERVLTVQVVDSITPYLTVEMNQPEFTSGEIIQYRIFMSKAHNPALVSETYKIKVDFVDNQDISANEIIMNGSSFHIASVPATHNMHQMRVKITNSNLTATKIIPLKIYRKISTPEAGAPIVSDQMLSSVYTKIKSNKVSISKPSVEVRVFHDYGPKTALAGHCEIFIGTLLSDVESFQQTNTTVVKEKVQNETTYFEYSRIDLIQELNLDPANITINGKSIYLKSRCYNNKLRRWVQEALPASEVFIYPTNFNVKLIWSEKPFDISFYEYKNRISYNVRKSIKQVFEVSRRDGISVSGDRLDLEYQTPRIGEDGTTSVLWDIAPPYGERPDKEILVEIGDFRNLLKLNDVPVKLPHMEFLFSKRPRTDKRIPIRLESYYRPGSKLLAINALSATSTAFLPSEREIVSGGHSHTNKPKGIEQELNISAPSNLHGFSFDYAVYGLAEYSPVRLNETEKYIFVRSTGQPVTQNRVSLTLKNITKLSSDTTRLSLSLTGEVGNITAVSGKLDKIFRQKYLAGTFTENEQCLIKEANTSQISHGNTNFVSNLPFKIETCEQVFGGKVTRIANFFFECPITHADKGEIKITKDLGSLELGKYGMTVLYSIDGLVSQTNKVFLDIE